MAPTPIPSKTPTPTKTPIPTPTPICVGSNVECGASNFGRPCCSPNVCKYFAVDTGTYWCVAPTPTRTPTATRTPTQTPTPTPSCGKEGKVCCPGSICESGTTCNTSVGLCINNESCTGLYTCSNSKLYPCLTCSTTNPGTCAVWNWGYVNPRTCAFGCNANNTGCNETGYCIDQTCGDPPPGCTSGNTLDWCWPSYNAFIASGQVNPTYTQCVNSTGCATVACQTTPFPTTCPNEQCTPVSDICTADTIVPPCSVRYPGDPSLAVEHHDNCYDPATGAGIGCGPACAAPTGVPCVPDCTGAGNVCSGLWYDDPTGCGRCLGTKNCVGTLTAESFAITAADTSCTAITTSTNSLAGTSFSFSPAVDPASQTQGIGPVTWNNVTTDGTTVYGISAIPAGPYAQANVCVSENGGAWTQASAGTLTDAGTIDFRVGYIPQSGWVQTKVGDVYAASQLTSSVPITATNPYFSLVGTGGTAGIVSYGTGYDFSLSANDLGETQVSPSNWLVNQSHAKIHYYERFNQTLRNVSKTAITSSLDSLTKPTCATNPCVFTISGDVTTAPSSPWAIGVNEQIILLVSGNVTISSNITVTSGGFFALMVNGNITIDPAVTTLHGMYIATTDTYTGVFTSGAGATQLSVLGSVIADEFSLQRDLGAINDTTPGEFFELNPQLLFTMPDVMKESPYVWQEVAP